MGERTLFQPLTREDKVSVVIYRLGIAICCVAVVVGALLMFSDPDGFETGSFPGGNLGWGGLLVDFFVVGGGLSSIFIHLYVSSFHRFLKRLYGIGVIGWMILLVLGSGNPLAPVADDRIMGLLLLPMAGCLAFVAAKEAFCFRLFEGYLLAIMLVASPVLVAVGAVTGVGLEYWTAVLGGVFVLFAGKKVFMPLHFDIGDKSAYQ